MNAQIEMLTRDPNATLRFVVTEPRPNSQNSGKYDHIVWVGEVEYDPRSENGKKNARRRMQNRLTKYGYNVKPYSVEEVEINGRNW